MFRTFVHAAIALALVAGSAAPAAARVPGGARAWTIGPIIDGRNYSVGMPLRPSPGPAGSMVIDLPPPPASAHYVTFPHGSLAGKSRIVMSFRVEAAPGASIRAATAPGSPGMVTLYFQRAGDNWSGRGPFEAYRWYATFATRTLSGPGEYRIVAPLSGNWTAVERSSARSNPVAFAEAKAQAGEVGFVLGGGDGYGKGVIATGPARIVVTDFRVE